MRRLLYLFKNNPVVTEQLLIENGFDPETIALDEAQMIYNLSTNGLSAGGYDIIINSQRWEQLSALFGLAALQAQGAYSASGNAIRMDGASVAAPGYESVPSDFTSFQLENLSSSESLTYNGDGTWISNGGLPSGQVPAGTLDEAFVHYETLIDDQVTILAQQQLTDSIISTFKDGYYRTVVTNEDIEVYRVFGGNADAGGGFATTLPAENRIQVKIDSALLPDWKNTRQYEATIVIPKGTVINIGKVDQQIIDSTGTILEGGADQILLPINWDLDWITEIHLVESK